MTGKARRSQTADRRPTTETILFCVTGMSPAIITETVWALAHENPPVIPDRVIAVTTTAGRDAVRRELFDTGIWDSLQAALRVTIRFGTTPDDIRVFTRADARGRSVELEDIRTPADNEAAADFLLDALRPFTENEDVRLVCSLAGGRKTMGALLCACVSLIGRETDRLTHVLVNEPFDDPRRSPRFYFPTPRDRTARIQLADVPFVPLRQLFPRELGRLPGRFTSLVRQYRSVVAELAAPPTVRIEDDEPTARINNVPVRLPATVLAFLDFLAGRSRNAQPAFAKYQEAVEPFQQFLATWGAGHSPFNFRSHDSIKNLQRSCTDQELRKLVNALKTGLRSAAVPQAVIQHLLPRRAHCGIRVR